MPELPEVEIVSRGLKKFVLNKKIIRVQSRCEKSFIGDKNQIEGQKITAINRRGKAILINLSNHYTLMIHLRMTGQLVWRGAENFAAGHPTDDFVGQLPSKQTRVILEFEDGTLYFNDQRKFGFIKVLPETEVENDKFIAKLAKEPWQMNAEEFYQVLQRHAKAPIKAVILDQSNIAGLGNIYADEALFGAKIHPARRAGTLTKTEAKNLLNCACEVMDKSIASGGSTMATYVRADGTKGDYLQKFAQVFRREGKECRLCGMKIIKIRCAGRGTHLCPNCQKEPND